MLVRCEAKLSMPPVDGLRGSTSRIIGCPMRAFQYCTSGDLFLRARLFDQRP